MFVYIVDLYIGLSRISVSVSTNAGFKPNLIRTGGPCQNRM